MKHLNLNGQRIDVTALVSKFPYVKTADLECLDGRPPMLLIGQLHIKFIQATEIYQPEPNAPAISKCILGWAVHGPYDVEQCGSQGVNVCCGEDDLHNLVASYILIEGMGVVQSKIDRQRSEDDRRAMNVIQQSVKYVNGHFIVNLPYKITTPFPESRKLALSRLKCTERKIHKLGISGKYADKILEYISKGYAVPVQYIKNLNAEHHADLYPEACALIIDDHYVDDCLGSQDDECRAAELIQDVIQIHSAGGFTIRNFRCSSSEVMESIPEELRASVTASTIGDCQQRV